MAGIINKIGDALHIGGNKEGQGDNKHKGDQHKSDQHGYGDDHKDRQEQQKGGLMGKIHGIGGSTGGDDHKDKEGKKKKEKKKKEKKEGDEHHGHSSSDSDSDSD